MSSLRVPLTPETVFTVKNKVFQTYWFTTFVTEMFYVLIPWVRHASALLTRSLRGVWIFPTLVLAVLLSWISQGRRPTSCCIFWMVFSDIISSKVLRKVLKKVYFAFLTVPKKRQLLCLLFIRGPRKVNTPVVHC
jgi:hypothetical protein